MAIVVFTKPVPFPIAPLRQTLAAQLPLYRWQIGEDDDGGAETLGSWQDFQLVAGRSNAAMVFCEIVTRPHALAEPAPLHTWHMEVKRPTSDNDVIANRLMMLICAVSMIPDDQAMCQLAPGGGWLSNEDMVRATKALIGGESIEKLAQFGRPASGMTAPAIGSPAAGRYADLPPDRAMMLGDMDETMARLLHERGMGEIADGMGLSKPPAFSHELPRANALPTMVMLQTTPAIFDWPLVREALQAVDGGHWTVEQAGPTHGILKGRGATISIKTENAALPGYLLVQAQARSHWLTEEDKRSIGAHRVHQTVTVDLDTRAAEFTDVRQAAKVATMFIGLAAKRHGFVGLFNAGVGTVMPADRVMSQVGILASDEVPIMLWTWAAFHSTKQDAISISTGGMLPFVGYEVELWNAPGTLESVGERLNGVLRYLLINGPVIEHGETIGDHADDRSTRCFHGKSRAERGDREISALLLEFDNRDSAGPRPDLPEAGDGKATPGFVETILDRIAAKAQDGASADAPPCPPIAPRSWAAAPGAAPPRRPGGFGRKGL